MSIPVAFWLLPGEQAMDRLTRIIDELAERYDAPRFVPHVSLHVDRVVRQADLSSLLDDTATRFAPFEMRAGPTEHSPMLFKTLFVTLSGSEINDLAAALAVGVAAWRPLTDGIRKTVAYRLDPHLSLLYKELSEAERATLCDRHRHNGELLYFDRIAMVTPVPGARDLSRVDDWLVSPLRGLVGPNPLAAKRS